MTTTVLSPARPAASRSDSLPSAGYKVDISRGERISRVSSEWFSRPDDERFLSLGTLHVAVRARAERATARTVETKALRVEASRDDAERLALIVPGQDTPVAPTHWSYGQLCSLVGAPASYMRQLPAPLAGINLQHGLLSHRAELVKTLEADDGRIEANVTLLGDIMNQPGNRYCSIYGLADPTFPKNAPFSRFSDAGKLMALASFSRRSEAPLAEEELMRFLLSASDVRLDMYDKLANSPYFDVGVEDAQFRDFAGIYSDRIFEAFHTFARANMRKDLPLIVAGGCGLNCDWNTNGLRPEPSHRYLCHRSLTTPGPR